MILSTPTYAQRPDKDKVSYILLWLGPQGVEVFDNFTPAEIPDRNKPSDVWDAFETYFEPKTNFRLARFQLRDMRQNPGEPIDSFVTRLRILGQKCNFKDTTELDDQLIDQVIKGSNNIAVRKKLLEHDAKTLTLPKCIDVARTSEATHAQMLQLGIGGGEATIASMRQSHTPAHKPASGSTNSRRSHQPRGRQGQSCFFCGGSNHQRDACPARDQTCNKCGKSGHWGKVCMSTGNKPQPQQFSPKKKNHSRGKGRGKASINEVTYENLPDEFEHLQFDAINNSGSRSEAYAVITIEPYPERTTNLRDKVDTGAQGNILPLRTFKAIFPKLMGSDGRPTSLKTSHTRLTAYNGSAIEHFGTMQLRCRYADSARKETTFFVADTSGPVIFGLPLCAGIGLVSINCSVTQSASQPVPIKDAKHLESLYPERFHGISKLPGKQSLVPREDAQGVIHPPRRAPVQLRDKIKSELERMVSLDVIRRVEEPTDWVSSITYSTKRNGSIRICLDPKDLNAALKRPLHHTPTIEELTHKFSGAKVFSKLDARSGYWGIELDEPSQLLTTFNTPFGRYCYKRLPFALNVSQDLFQRTMDVVLEDLPGVVSIADDIVCTGKDDKEHDRNLHLLMARAQERGLVFNLDKCAVKTPEINFFGNQYTKDGVQPDPDKVQAIADINPPSDAKELQQFLGLVTYLSAYIPRLSDHTSILRDLLKKDSEFQWHPEHQDAFDALKKLICHSTKLSYFDPNKDTIIQVDASSVALGAALTQEGKVVAYAAKSLTDTERRYANIERELLACVFGAERFHTYVYGKPFVIESDHKPLEMIQGKPLAAAPVRLQRMLLRMQGYDCTTKYRPGSEMTLADCLSRLPTRNRDPEIPLDVQVSLVQFSSPRLEELRRATREDPVLSHLMEYIATGFPATRRDTHSSTHDYWSFRDELSIEDGLVLKGTRVVIPEKLRDQFMKDVHAGHQGVTRCQQRARTCIYWPGIDKAIADHVSTCTPCQQYQSSQPKETLMPVIPDLPNIPWHTLGTDLFTLIGDNYLIISDYHTKYLVVEKLGPDSTSKRVADLTSKYFSLFGVPNTIISDNGPQFVGAAYQSLLQKYGVTHITSSPWHPESHGFIERAIRTAKSMLRKSHDSDLALLVFRTTPPGPQEPSPAEMLFGRKAPSNLPTQVHPQLTHPQRESTRHSPHHHQGVSYLTFTLASQYTTRIQPGECGSQEKSW